MVVGTVEEREAEGRWWVVCSAVVRNREASEVEVQSLVPIWQRA